MTGVWQSPVEQFWHREFMNKKLNFSYRVAWPKVGKDFLGTYTIRLQSNIDAWGSV